MAERIPWVVEENGKLIVKPTKGFIPEGVKGIAPIDPITKRPELAEDLELVDDIREIERPVYELDENGDRVTEEVEETRLDAETGEEVTEIVTRPVQLIDAEGNPVFETVTEVVGKKPQVNEAKKAQRIEKEKQELQEQELKEKAKEEKHAEHITSLKTAYDNFEDLRAAEKYAALKELIRVRLEELGADV